MVTNTAEIRVGRLLEVRADAGYSTVAQVDALFDLVEAAMAKLRPSDRTITIADWRRCPVMEAKASERLVQRIIKLNARVERSVAVASQGSCVAVLQFMRLIRESGNPDRKMFFDTEEALAWLQDVLSKQELERARQFLAR